MGCGDVRLLRTIGGLDVTGQERAALNKLTIPQRVLINGYRGYLERHSGRRPKRADSFHTALRETHIEPFLDNWSLFEAFT